MRVLIAHNFYEQAGGEDAVVKSEYELLQKKGDDVFLYERNNQEIDSLSFTEKLKLFSQLEWSRKTYDDLRARIREFRPDVVHFHNIFYMITPAAYDACHDEGVPVVQSQHNFRPLCSNGLFFRQGAVCEECLHHSLWRGVLYGCFKDSRPATLIMARMLMAHQKKQTWNKKVDRYITATEFTRKKYVESGIPPEKISIKPHFIFAGNNSPVSDQGYALYMGRLSPEKGVDVLLKAWERLPQIPLKIMGSGPLAEELKDYARKRGMGHVQFLGFVPPQQLEYNLKSAKFLVLPSVCYENFPRTVAESFSYGIPILASRLGSIQDLVTDQKTGVLFEPGNPQDMADKARWLIEHPQEFSRMRQLTRQEYTEKYMPEENYQGLMAIYQKTIAEFKGKG